MTAAHTTRSILERTDLILRRLFSLRRACLRIRSFYSGISYSKLKLYYLIGVHLDQVLIVERGTGRILDRWSESSHFGTGNKKEIQQRAIAKMLVAICELDKNPKAVFHGGLPVLDLSGSYAYLHATPVYILAAKYSGPAIDKLKRYIDSALQSSVRAAPDLLYFFGTKSGGLRGTAGQVASALEKLLLDANMPPYGEVRRPVFAYAAIAALSLVGITATGEAIVQKYVSAKVQGANELNRALTDFAPSAGAIVPPQMRIIAGDAGHAAQGARRHCNRLRSHPAVLPRPLWEV